MPRVEVVMCLGLLTAGVAKEVGNDVVGLSPHVASLRLVADASPAAKVAVTSFA